MPTTRRVSLLLAASSAVHAYHQSEFVELWEQVGMVVLLRDCCDESVTILTLQQEGGRQSSVCFGHNLGRRLPSTVQARLAVDR